MLEDVLCAFPPLEQETLEERIGRRNQWFAHMLIAEAWGLDAKGQPREEC